IGKIAIAPRADGEFETFLSGTGVNQQSIKILYRLLLFAADDLGERVLHHQVVMEETPVTVGCDSFLILALHLLQSGCNQRIVGSEDVLGISAQQVAPVLALAIAVER